MKNKLGKSAKNQACSIHSRSPESPFTYMLNLNLGMSAETPDEFAKAIRVVAQTATEVELLAERISDSKARVVDCDARRQACIEAAGQIRAANRERLVS